MKLIHAYIVAKIPRSALLSSKTTAIAGELEQEYLQSRLPECMLAFAFMYELRTDESPWKGYVESLPTDIKTPYSWKGKDQKWLHGTEADHLHKSYRVSATFQEARKAN